MSHYVNIETEIKDRKALVKALERMGFEGKVEVYDVATNLYGYHGDMRDDKAHVILRRKDVGSASNDIGYIQMQDGRFKAIISEYDSTKYNEEWQNMVSTYHNVEVAKAEAEEYGYTVTEDVDEEQRPRLRIVI